MINHQMKIIINNNSNFNLIKKILQKDYLRIEKILKFLKKNKKNKLY